MPVSIRSYSPVSCTTVIGRIALRYSPSVAGARATVGDSTASKTASVNWLTKIWEAQSRLGTPVGGLVSRFDEIVLVNMLTPGYFTRSAERTRVRFARGWSFATTATTRS